MKKKGLGRGLGSLLRDEDFITDENLLTVDLDKPMLFAPRNALSSVFA